MRLQDIEYIIAVDRCKSIKKAAEQLNISQPALSQTISRIENELGCNLFEQNKKAICLTPKGHVFINLGSNIVTKYHELLSQMNVRTYTKDKKLVVGASPMYAKHYFPKVYTQFSQDCPDVTLFLFEGLSIELLSKLEKREIDMAVTSSHNTTLDLVYTPLYQETELFAISNDRYNTMKDCFYVKDGKEFVDLGRFKDVNFITYHEENNMAEITKELCVEKNFEPKISFIASSADLVNSMVSCDMGVGIVPSLAIQYSLVSDSCHYAYIESKHATRIYNIVYIKGASISEQAKQYIEISRKLHSHLEFHHNFLKKWED